MSRVRIPSVALLPSHDGPVDRTIPEYRPVMHLVAVQFSPTWLDPVDNRRRIEETIREVPPGSFVVLPEMCDTGWCLDAGALPDTHAATLAWASTLAAERAIHLQVGLAMPVERSPGLANVAVIAHPDGSLGPFYEKMHPFGFTVEPAVYVAGRAIVLDRVGEAVAAPSICYDLRFPELHRLAVAGGAQILSIGANWPRARIAHWRSLAIARAIENQSCVIAVNRVGSDPDHEYGGNSMIIGPDGGILAEAGDSATLLEADLDLDELLERRRSFPALVDRRDELLGRADIDRGSPRVPGRPEESDVDREPPDR